MNNSRGVLLSLSTAIVYLPSSFNMYAKSFLEGLPSLNRSKKIRFTLPASAIFWYFLPQEKYSPKNGALVIPAEINGKPVENIFL